MEYLLSPKHHPGCFTYVVLFYLQKFLRESYNCAVSKCEKQNSGRKMRKTETCFKSCLSLQNTCLLVLCVCCSLQQEWPAPGFCMAGFFSSFGSIEISWGRGAIFLMESCPLPAILSCIIQGLLLLCSCTSHNKKALRCLRTSCLLCLSLPTEAHSYETGVLCILFPSLSPELRRISGKE